MTIYIDGHVIAIGISALGMLGFMIFAIGYDYGYKTAWQRSKDKFWIDLDLEDGE